MPEELDVEQKKINRAENFKYLVEWIESNIYEKEVLASRNKKMEWNTS